MAKYGEITIKLSLQEAEQVAAACVDKRIHNEKLLKNKVRPVGTTTEQLKRFNTLLKGVSEILLKELNIKWVEGY